jgi:hypothetical protein
MHKTEPGAVVRLRGEAGVVEAGALEAALASLAARRPVSVTFDLSELHLLSSLAIGVLVAFRRAAVRAGARVGLAPDLHAAARAALTRAEVLGLFEVPGASVAGSEPGPVAKGLRDRYPDMDEVHRTYGLTWGQLAALEPQLETLLWRARTAAVTCRSSVDVPRRFDPVRAELAGLIGFAGKHHQHPVLGSSAAYAVAYWKLYDAVAGLLPSHDRGAAEVPDKQRGGTVPGPCPGESAAPRDEAGFIDGLGI